MPVFETYASRVAAAAKTGAPDIYTYDDLTPLLRKQISKIFTECIGPGWGEPKGFVPGADGRSIPALLASAYSIAWSDK
jgi:hypothetical protein